MSTITIYDVRHWLTEVSYKDGWRFQVIGDTDLRRAYLQVVVDGRCNVSGDPMEWSGRKWQLSRFMTKSEVIQTAFKAAITAEEHECRENFLYRGASIFDPHYDVDRLHALRVLDPDCLVTRD